MLGQSFEVVWRESRVTTRMSTYLLKPPKVALHVDILRMKYIAERESATVERLNHRKSIHFATRNDAQSRNNCGLVKIARRGFPGEKTTPRFGLHQLQNCFSR